MSQESNTFHQATIASDVFTFSEERGFEVSVVGVINKRPEVIAALTLVPKIGTTVEVVHVPNYYPHTKDKPVARYLLLSEKDLIDLKSTKEL